jgi:hypothetical protein
MTRAVRRGTRPSTCTARRRERASGASGARELRAKVSWSSKTQEQTHGSARRACLGGCPPARGASRAQRTWSSRRVEEAPLGAGSRRRTCCKRHAAQPGHPAVGNSRSAWRARARATSCTRATCSALRPWTRRVTARVARSSTASQHGVAARRPQLRAHGWCFRASVRSVAQLARTNSVHARPSTATGGRRASARGRVVVARARRGPPQRLPGRYGLEASEGLQKRPRGKGSAC